ncbi:hypothetical protein [Iningainema tapete]|uniref:Uncharacterized protein n=1 Tax=Iningainema tapete BLCC-T55 TaxID=2748662 RepID=A0A8J6XNC8_9CYAN|nr:hypothetical protein [Iningainema tapete]MBD2778253.1 hypothetical protein [Iningainema tapete BLCC-T55]
MPLHTKAQHKNEDSATLHYREVTNDKTEAIAYLIPYSQLSASTKFCAGRCVIT